MKTLKLKTHRLIENNGKNYIFISDTASLFEIDDYVKNMINESDGLFVYDSDSEKDNEVMQILDKAGFFTDTFKEPDWKSKINESQPSALVLMLSQDCNLRCNYCYAGDGEYCNKGLMKESTAKMAIDYAFDNFTEDKISIILFGGEPLLNKNLFKFCVEYAKKKAEESSKEVSFSTTTNATLLNMKNAKIIIENKFSVTISIDGDAKTHNQNRFYANKKGTYDDVVNNVKNYLGFKNVAARATLTKYNPKIKDIYEHLYGLGFRSIHISPSIEFMDRDAYDKLILSYLELIDTFEKKLKLKDYDYCLRMSNIMAFLNRLNKGGLRRKFCGACNNMLTVDIDGSFHGCHRFVATPELNYGNIMNHNAVEDDRKNGMLEALIQNHDSVCRNCWISGICGGGCPAENMASNKDLKRPHDLTCHYLKSIMPKIIELYIGLSSEEKRIFFDYKK